MTTDDAHQVIHLTLITLSDYSSCSSSFMRSNNFQEQETSNDENVEKVTFQKVVHDALQNCTHATTMTSPTTSNDKIVKQQSVSLHCEDDMVRSVTKFLKINDQYSALASLLLKSKAYQDTVHELTKAASSVNELDDDLRKRIKLLCCCIKSSSKNLDSNEVDVYGVLPSSPLPSLPIVALPKTQYGKPYIPEPDFMQKFRRKEFWSRKEPTWNNNSMSISHQYPFVASARFKLDWSGQEDMSHTQQRRRLVQMASSTTAIGLDIVVWDPTVTKNPSPDDFLKYFRSCFTTVEWNSVCSSPAPIKEFHIRWSMKEAYTKALGYGMSLDFDSFELLPAMEDLGGVQRANASSDFYWHHDVEKRAETKDALSNGSGLIHSPVYHRLVRVCHLKPNLRWDPDIQKQRFEKWNFWFLPLPCFSPDDVQGETRSATTTSDIEIDTETTGPFSMACICTGDTNLEKARFTLKSKARIHVESMMFKDLLSWHSRNKSFHNVT